MTSNQNKNQKMRIFLIWSLTFMLFLCYSTLPSPLPIPVCTAFTNTNTIPNNPASTSKYYYRYSSSILKNRSSVFHMHQLQDEEEEGVKCNEPLTPFRARYDPFVPNDSYEDKDKEDEQEQGIPLTPAIRALMDTLHYILQSNNSISIEKYIHTLADGTNLLRLEQRIADHVDPLRWLRVQYDQIDNHRTVVYFADAEGMTDVVGIGSMHTLHSDGELGAFEWDVIQSIPPFTRYYGGMRFDPDYPMEHRDVQWQNFGGHYFVLPTVELRKDWKSNQLKTEAVSVTTIKRTVEESQVVEQLSSKKCMGDNMSISSKLEKQHTASVAINLRFGQSQFGSSKYETINDAIHDAIHILDSCLLDVSIPMVAPILPCIVNQEENKNTSQEDWETGVNEALIEMTASMNGHGVDGNSTKTTSQPNDSITKVVLARSVDTFLGDSFHPLDTLLRYKISDHYGHLLLLRPESLESKYEKISPAFFSFAPERLFRVDNKKLETEALAGTRPRGSDAKADADLFADLISNPKDLSENIITANFIQEVFNALRSKGLINFGKNDICKGDRFVRRLRHLQHICQNFSAEISEGVEAITLARDLMKCLHPTPAVCGFPIEASRNFIRKYESFDRGFYAGPFGYIGHERCDIVVSLRSGLISSNMATESTPIKLTTYAGAGIVPGSTAQDEWTETQHKLGVVRSLFSPAPLTLRGLPNANYAWATTIVEELIRLGVTDFMICPGSRSTPLTVVLARAARKHIGTIRVTSVHDERGAVFRCVGSARATGRPAVVVTSSGTAVANLYPGVMEASNDGVPLLLLTADRPYEARNTGANQAVDQVKVFGERVRWFRDIPPPNDIIPISVGLSDINHAVSVASNMMGPVHLNIQFRENLAPEAGVIRGDNRVDSVEAFNLQRFTDVPGFQKWAYGGSPFQQSFMNSALSPSVDIRAVRTVAELLRTSRRAIIVVGNVRGIENSVSHSIISHAAISWGVPIFADVQSGCLRKSSAVVPFADHVLKNDATFKNLKPDLVLQIGHPLISIEVQKLIETTMNSQYSLNSSPSHVLIHPHHSNERADPWFTVTHRISCDIGIFLNTVMDELNRAHVRIYSELSPIVQLGHQLREAMPQLIHTASKNVCDRHSITDRNGELPLTEPQVVLAINEVLSQRRHSSLFLSNSMPVRDGEAFLYPLHYESQFPSRVAVNRGASGIDGIISTASAFSLSLQSPTTLLVGDVAALHDLNALHTLGSDSSLISSPLTIVIVNNNGGGIFSFLPISKHGDDVGFDEYFGTPTETFSFAAAAQASGIAFRSSSSFELFKASYTAAIDRKEHSIVEARVVDRQTNVEVHSEISRLSSDFVDKLLVNASPMPKEPLNLVEYNEAKPGEPLKTMLLLHGWLGSKSDWDTVAHEMSTMLPGWKFLSIDLPGHGDFPIASNLDEVRDALNMNNISQFEYSVDGLAASLLSYLHDNEIKLDAICGYSLGGRVSLAMRRLSLTSKSEKFSSSVVSENTKTILLSAYPGEIGSDDQRIVPNNTDQRLRDDDDLAQLVKQEFNRLSMVKGRKTDVWLPFLDKWYSSQLWGGLQESSSYKQMTNRRAEELNRHGLDLSKVLQNCSPSRNSVLDWKFVVPGLTLFVAGSLDSKYSEIGRNWSQTSNINYEEIEQVGHALLTEDPITVAKIISDFVVSNEPPCVIGNRSYTSIDGMRRVISEKEILQPIDNPMFLNISLMDLNYFDFEFGKAENRRGVFGIGWADNSRPTSAVKLREGIILTLSCDGLEGIGEVSPLSGLHPENLPDARRQLETIMNAVNNETIPKPIIDASSILALEGGLTVSVINLVEVSGISPTDLLPSVRTGIEMALISLAAQNYNLSIPEALRRMSKYLAWDDIHDPIAVLPINGIETRTPEQIMRVIDNDDTGIAFQSMKIKLGHRSVEDDASFLVNRIQDNSNQKVRVRADANRSWTENDALRFASFLTEHEFDRNNIEYIEEPVENLSGVDMQIKALESFTSATGLQYALDETLADLVFEENFHVEDVVVKLQQALRKTKGCAAFVIKPTLLGTEVSLKLTHVAHELGIAAVYTSSFESGVGLSYIAYIASLSDAFAHQRKTPTFPHGLGTFTLIQDDIMNPEFASFVSSTGEVDITRLANSYHSSSLEETNLLSTQQVNTETTVQASITLPFSTELACARFADWPQQPRWSPWLASVTYVDESDSSSVTTATTISNTQSETEWTLNIRGLRLQWRAMSTIQSISAPRSYAGARVVWQSVSGLLNRGQVEFLPLDSNTSCRMTATVTFRTPRPVTAIFENNEFLTEFLKNKLLRWSLEMFRDVVRSDLALERGDTELGDALFGAVEGKAEAIEATLMLGNRGEEWQ